MSDKAVWSSAYVADLPDSSFACVDSAGRHYPHHDAKGNLDLPHLRAALSRVGDPDNTQCGKDHLEAHARAEKMGDRGKAFMPLVSKALDPDEERAFWAGELPRRLLAIPFGGPIPSPKSKRGVDLDDEFFDERTDIYGPYPVLRKERVRLVDFQHAYRPGPNTGDDTGMMTGHIIGKSILDPDPEEDGWWVDLWVERGNRRVALVEAIAKRGAQLFGSSQAIGKAVREDDGHIAVWPYYLQTIATTPQNTYSVMRPKAAVKAAESAGIRLSAGLQELAESLDSLTADLTGASAMGTPAGAEPGRDVVADAIEAHGKALDRLRSVIR